MESKQITHEDQQENGKLAATNVKKCAHFCAIVRHGERMDQAKGVNPHDLANPFDPPLSKLGLSQAERTGEFFAKLCPRKVTGESTEESLHLGFDYYVIETSPFLRCVQTAAKIAEKLGVTKIKINYMASEFLNAQMYPEGCPMSKIEFAKVMKIGRSDRQPVMTKFKQDNQINTNIDIVPSTRFRKEIYKTYPEERFDAQYRTLKLHEVMLEKVWRAGCHERRGLQDSEAEREPTQADEKNLTFRNVCYIIISHGMFIDNMATVMDSIHEPALHGASLTKENESELQSLTTKRLLTDIYTCQIKPPQFKSLIEDSDVWGKGVQPRVVYCSFSGGTLNIEYSGASELEQKDDLLELQDIKVEGKADEVLSDHKIAKETEHLKYVDVLKYFDDYKFKFTHSHKRYADHVENML